MLILQETTIFKVMQTNRYQMKTYNRYMIAYDSLGVLYELLLFNFYAFTKRTNREKQYFNKNLRENALEVLKPFLPDKTSLIAPSWNAKILV